MPPLDKRQQVNHIKAVTRAGPIRWGRPAGLRYHRSPAGKLAAVASPYTPNWLRVIDELAFSFRAIFGISKEYELGAVLTWINL